MEKPFKRIVSHGLRSGYLMMDAELDGIICSGARQGNQFTYALLDERVHPVKAFTSEEALAALTLRYFTSRGPATLHDFAYWSGLTMRAARAGVEMVKQYLTQKKIDEVTYWLVPGEITASNNFQQTFLMPDYDEYGMSYRNRNALFTAHDSTIEKQNVNLAYNRMLIVDGKIKGSWKRTVKKEHVIVEIQVAAQLRDDAIPVVMAAAERFGCFLGKEVQVVL